MAMKGRPITRTESLRLQSETWKTVVRVKLRVKKMNVNSGNSCAARAAWWSQVSLVDCNGAT